MSNIKSSSQAKKADSVSLDEKIKIFEEFQKTGAPINGSTMFKGYPIGHWGVLIRNTYNRTVKGKMSYHFSQEQIKKLCSLGILDCQKDPSVNDKIQALVEWMHNFPNVKPSQFTFSQDDLKSYSSSKKNYEKNAQEFLKMYQYYMHVKEQFYLGYLTDEQFLKCKEASIGGVFGFPSSIENISAKINEPAANVDYIINTFGSLENFIKEYRKGNFVGKDLSLANSMCKNTLDIDCNPNSEIYNNLVYDILYNNNSTCDMVFYSSKALQEQLDSLLEKHRNIIENIYGFNGNRKTSVQLASQVGISRQRINAIVIKNLDKLKKRSNKFTYINKSLPFEFTSQELPLLTPEERKQYESLLQSFNLNASLTHLDAKNSILQLQEYVEPIKMQLENRQNVISDALSGMLNILGSLYVNTKNENFDLMPIKDLDLSNQIRNCLNKQGYNTLADIKNLTPQEISSIRNIGPNAINEISAVIKSYDTKKAKNFSYIEESKHKMEEKQSQLIPHIQEVLENTYANSKDGRKMLVKDLPIDMVKDNTKIFTSTFWDTIQDIGFKNLGEIALLNEKDLTNISSKYLTSDMQKIFLPDVEKNILNYNSDPNLRIKISELCLSNRALHCLTGIGIETLQDIANLKYSEIANMHYAGKKTVTEILDVLSKYNLTVQPYTDISEQNSILANLRYKKDSLKHANNVLKDKISSAEDLLDSYNKLSCKNNNVIKSNNDEQTSEDGVSRD